MPRKSKTETKDLWDKCAKCEQIIFKKELDENFKICPKCGYYFRLTAYERINMLVEEGSFKELFSEILPSDPLNFKDIENYTTKLKSQQRKTKLQESVVTGTGKIDTYNVALGVLDFRFMGGSMGAVVGEKITLLVEYAIEEKLPLIIVSASGGARMQEGIISLMQMAKTSAAISKYKKIGLPFISIITDPTTGGVTASFSMLGDIIIAEPKALIGFAGPRVIKQTIKQELPEDFQTSEFLLEHGFIDIIAERKNLKKTIIQLLSIFLPQSK